MNMKRQISGCIFFVIIFLSISYFFIQNHKEPNSNHSISKSTEVPSDGENQERAIEISKDYENYTYVVKAEDDYLVVYDFITKEKYLDTGIKASNLPRQILEDSFRGIYFKNLQELYDFLESYSS